MMNSCQRQSLSIKSRSNRNKKAFASSGKPVPSVINDH